MFYNDYKTNDMSIKNQSKLVVNCSNNTAKTLLESEKFQVLPPTPKVPLRERCGSRNVFDEERSCWSVKNPWLLRVSVVFTLAVAIIVFGALQNKLRTSLYTTNSEVLRLQNIILTFDEKIQELEASVECLKSVNGTDTKGRPCPKLKGERDDRPNTQSSTKYKPNKADRLHPSYCSSKKCKGRRRTVFVRWGTSQCRTSNKSHTTLVYKGRVASPNYRDKGGGTNYLCMPGKALYTSRVDISTADRAFLYPVKFGPVTKVFNMFADKAWYSRLKNLPEEKRKMLNYTLDYKDVPCAVCRVDGATASLMIPAYNVCPPTWDRQYHGYLMSQKHDNEKSELICVDVEARGIPNTMNKNANSLLHLTEYKCGTSPCGRLQPRKALACAVCTT